MSSPPRASEASLNATEPPQLVSLGWALRRTALWLAMLMAMVVLGVWVMYASIDPDEVSASMPGGTESAAPPQATGSITK